MYSPYTPSRRGEAQLYVYLYGIVSYNAAKTCDLVQFLLHSKQCVSSTKTTPLMLKEMLASYSNNHTKPTNILSEHNNILRLKHVLYNHSAQPFWECHHIRQLQRTSFVKVTA